MANSIFSEPINDGDPNGNRTQLKGFGYFAKMLNKPLGYWLKRMFSNLLALQRNAEKYDGSVRNCAEYLGALHVMPHQ